MIGTHYGTTPIIRQCIQPGMMALREGRTDAEIIRVNDRVIDVLLDGTGHPIQH